MTARFTVVGEALVDLVEDPVAPQIYAAHAGGSLFNVAVTLGRLGADVALVARRGPDGFGELLEHKLRDSGVRLDHWRTVPAPTTVAVASVDETGQARYGFYLDATATSSWEQLPADLIAQSDVLHLGSLASWYGASSAVVRALQRRAFDAGSPLVSYDPNMRPAMISDLPATRSLVEECVAAAHVVKASDEDLTFLHPDATPAQTAARWCGLGAALVVVTRGSAGAIAFDAAGEVAACPGSPVTVVDTVGAGDSFAGGLLAALGRAGLARPDALRAAVTARDERLGAALRQAVTVSAMTCERAGANPPTAAELADRIGTPA